MSKTLHLCLILICLSVLPGWADGDLDPSVHLHSWGVEADLAWRPLVLVPGTETTFWAGGEVLYKSWNYFHNPVYGTALDTASSSDAAVKEFAGSWFLGMSQGIVGHKETKAEDLRNWANPNLVEVFGYYRGTELHPLSTGSYLSTSNLPDRSGYLQSAFLGGVDLNLLTKADGHNLKSGLIVEGAGEVIPQGLQSVAVDANRLTGIVSGYLPLYDLAPDRRLNLFSVMGGVNLVWDHLWGTQIPAQELQRIGGRSLDGVVGYVEGLGGQVRGIEDGRFDGKDKVIGNMEIRFNLPGIDFPEFVHSWSPIPVRGSVIPGIVAYYDYGAYDGLSGFDPGSVSSAGLGVYLQVGNLGAVAFYMNDWLTGGAPYSGNSMSWTGSLGMQF